jgi:methenyltetrahydromethanopterin cyclohydrolase
MTVPILKDILDNSMAYGIEVSELANGATVVDMGVSTVGGWAAAKRFIDVTFGGLAQTSFSQMNVGQLEFPCVDVFVDHPAACLLGIEISGWVFKDLKGSFGIPALGSGPARAVSKCDDLGKMSDYADKNPPDDLAILALQTEILPDDTTAEYVAQCCRTTPDKVFLLAARTGSIVGMANVASRTLETTIELFDKVGLDPECALAGYGRAPIAPAIDNELMAMAMSNTFVYYGGTVIYTVDAPDDAVRDATKRLALTPETCPAYGVDFKDLFEEAGKDIFKMTSLWQSVCRVIMHNKRSGRVYSAGTIDHQVLSRCLSGV